ncbi:hypothetical protein HGM15179_020209 [Zosterops borbonicus]|uniref:Uncharacterized protein n=1 Tax=Zosterops borbonicus TaxID=364589 RepID=A0A8K1D9M0_9PASS|nr:hypothetical protein HGM15179_020209 [Zosterops borbonicus]
MNNPSSQPVSIAEVLQSSEHLHSLLWTHSNRWMSFLCQGLQSWMLCSRKQLLFHPNWFISLPIQLLGGALYSDCHLKMLRGVRLVFPNRPYSVHFRDTILHRYTWDWNYLGDYLSFREEDWWVYTMQPEDKTLGIRCNETRSNFDLMRGEFAVPNDYKLPFNLGPSTWFS